MSVIYLVVLMCVDASCEQQAAFVKERYVGETVQAVEDCRKPRDKARRFYTSNKEFQDTEVHCWDRDELAKMGFNV